MNCKINKIDQQCSHVFVRNIKMPTAIYEPGTNLQNKKHRSHK